MEGHCQHGINLDTSCEKCRREIKVPRTTCIHKVSLQEDCAKCLRMNGESLVYKLDQFTEALDQQVRVEIFNLKFYQDNSYTYVFKELLVDGTMHEHAHAANGRLEICTSYNLSKKPCDYPAIFGMTLIHGNTPVEQI